MGELESVGMDEAMDELRLRPTMGMGLVRGLALGLWLMMVNVCRFVKERGSRWMKKAKEQRMGDCNKHQQTRHPTKHDRASLDPRIFESSPIPSQSVTHALPFHHISLYTLHLHSLPYSPSLCRRVDRSNYAPHLGAFF